jgi:hypothetical protein
MKKSISFEIPEDLLLAECESELGWELAPGESLIWRGRPETRSGLLQRTLPTALCGALLICLSPCLVWVTSIEDLKSHSKPADLLVGLLLFASGLSMFSLPFRIWLRARKTRYFLTDRRAIVCEPTLFGGYRASSYGAEALVLMRREEFRDGTGDLVFGDYTSGFGGILPRGFLAIEQVRVVELLVRKLVFDARPVPRTHGTDPSDDPEFRPQFAANKLDDRKIYRSPMIYRAFPLVLLGFCAIGTPILIAGIVVMLLGPSLLAWIGMANSTLQGMIVLFIFGVGVSGLLTLYFIKVPFEIAVKKDATLELRSWMRTIELRPQDIISIQTGGWNDPRRVEVRIRHEGGRMVLNNHFSDFREFLVTLKSLNPSIEIKGF